MTAVLVTGATGFLGTRLVPRLIARGFEVLGLHRASSDRRALAGLELEWIEGDLTDADSLRAACARLAAHDPAGWVIHSGALISYRSRDAEAQARVNVDGSRQLFEALVDAGLTRLLHVSSVVTVGFSDDARVTLDESGLEPPPVRSAYVRTKYEAEQLALAFGRAPGRDVRVVNPGAIFGPSRASNTSRFLDDVRRRGAPWLVPPGSLSPVGVDDVAEGICLALERGRTGRRYLLTESAATLFEIYTKAAAAFGRRGPRGVVPGTLWRALAAAAVPLDRMRPLELLTPESLELLGAHFRYDSARARAELGWRPRPFDEVLAEVVAFLEAPGVAPEVAPEVD